MPLPSLLCSSDFNEPNINSWIQVSNSQQYLDISNIQAKKSISNPAIPLQYLDVLTAGSKSVRFFLPLCGKAGDLVHLYNEGHTVTGVEGVPFVVEQFFRENKLDYEKVSLPEIRGWKYKVSQVSQQIKMVRSGERENLKVMLAGENPRKYCLV